MSQIIDLGTPKVFAVSLIGVNDGRPPSLAVTSVWASYLKNNEKLLNASAIFEMNFAFRSFIWLICHRIIS